jgi:NAD(P)H dehydrogenase (quinone)
MAGNNPLGLLRDKKVIIINSMGQTLEEYEELGMFKAMNLTTDTGIFSFCGMNVICHKYFTSIMSVSDEQRQNYFKEIKELVEQVAENKAVCVS